MHSHLFDANWRQMNTIRRWQWRSDHQTMLTAELQAKSGDVDAGASAASPGGIMGRCLQRRRSYPQNGFGSGDDTKTASELLWSPTETPRTASAALCTRQCFLPGVWKWHNNSWRLCFSQISGTPENDAKWRLFLPSDSVKRRSSLAPENVTKRHHQWLQNGAWTAPEPHPECAWSALVIAP